MESKMQMLRLNRMLRIAARSEARRRWERGTQDE